MINFFRKTRKKLADNNQFLKYSRYALGEIVLVMVGILLALQVNNWNENRLNKLEVKSYLNNLIQDLNDDQGISDRLKEWHSFKYFSMQYLLNMEGTSPYNPIADRKEDIPSYNTSRLWDKEIPEVYDKEFIQLAFSVTHRAYKPPFIKPTFDELKSTGMYSKIKPNLKKEINSYYIQRENYFNDKVQKLAMDWQANLAEEGFITTDTYKFADPISLIKNNPKRIGLMKRMIRESGWLIQSSLGQKTEIEGLIQLIEKEIDAL